MGLGVQGEVTGAWASGDASSMYTDEGQGCDAVGNHVMQPNQQPDGAVCQPGQQPDLPKRAGSVERRLVQLRAPLEQGCLVAGRGNGAGLDVLTDIEARSSTQSGGPRPNLACEAPGVDEGPGTSAVRGARVKPDLPGIVEEGVPSRMASAATCMGRPWSSTRRLLTSGRIAPTGARVPGDQLRAMPCSSVAALH